MEKLIEFHFTIHDSTGFQNKFDEQVNAGYFNLWFYDDLPAPLLKKIFERIGQRAMERKVRMDVRTRPGLNLDNLLESCLDILPYLHAFALTSFETELTHESAMALVNVLKTCSSLCCLVLLHVISLPDIPLFADLLSLPSLERLLVRDRNEQFIHSYDGPDCIDFDGVILNNDTILSVNGGRELSDAIIGKLEENRERWKKVYWHPSQHESFGEPVHGMVMTVEAGNMAMPARLPQHILNTVFSFFHNGETRTPPWTLEERASVVFDNCNPRGLSLW